MVIFCLDVEQYDIYLKYLMIWFFIGRHILSTAGILFFHLTASQTTKKDRLHIVDSFWVRNDISYWQPDQLWESIHSLGH